MPFFVSTREERKLMRSSLVQQRAIYSTDKIKYCNRMYNLPGRRSKGLEREKLKASGTRVRRLPFGNSGKDAYKPYGGMRLLRMGRSFLL